MTTNEHITAYRKKHNKQAAGLNTEIQHYKGIPIRLIIRNYSGYNAKRYTLNETRQNVWIPNKFLRADGTLMNGRNIDFVFIRARNQCRLAGLSGIKWLGI